jgi:putative acetyltransferase
MLSAPSVKVRDFRIGDEPALYAVFYSAVHEIASQHYAPDQIDAWAPESPDMAIWTKRMQGIRPFVVECGGQIVAYADIQASGYIDHFFVSGPFSRRGVGTILMNRIHDAAQAQKIDRLTSDVSRTAQPFFRRFGFRTIEDREPVIRGVMVPNARMEKQLQ